METFKGGEAHQGLCLRLAGVGKGEGVEKGDGVTYYQHGHHQFENGLGQVDLNRFKKHDEWLDIVW